MSSLNCGRPQRFEGEKLLFPFGWALLYNGDDAGHLSHLPAQRVTCGRNPQRSSVVVRALPQQLQCRAHISST